jgi:hypothetical protein
MNTLNLVLGGPTADYTTIISESALVGASGANGAYSPGALFLRTRSAVAASISDPVGLFIDRTGTLYVSDASNPASTRQRARSLAAIATLAFGQWCRRPA